MELGVVHAAVGAAFEQNWDLYREIFHDGFPTGKELEDCGILKDAAQDFDDADDKFTFLVDELSSSEDQFVNFVHFVDTRYSPDDASYFLAVFRGYVQTVIAQEGLVVKTSDAFGAMDACNDLINLWHYPDMAKSALEWNDRLIVNPEVEPFFANYNHNDALVAHFLRMFQDSGGEMITYKVVPYPMALVWGRQNPGFNRVHRTLPQLPKLTYDSGKQIFTLEEMKIFVEDDETTYGRMEPFCDILFTHRAPEEICATMTPRQREEYYILTSKAFEHALLDFMSREGHYARIVFNRGYLSPDASVTDRMSLRIYEHPTPGYVYGDGAMFREDGSQWQIRPCHINYARRKSNGRLTKVNKRSHSDFTFLYAFGLVL